jgi:hypothetical protein
LPLVVGENFAFTRQGKILRFFTPQVKILWFWKFTFLLRERP